MEGILKDTLQFDLATFLFKFSRLVSNSAKSQPILGPWEIRFRVAFPLFIPRQGTETLTS